MCANPTDYENIFLAVEYHRAFNDMKPIKLIDRMWCDYIQIDKNILWTLVCVIWWRELPYRGPQQQTLSNRTHSNVHNIISYRALCVYNALHVALHIYLYNNVHTLAFHCAISLYIPCPLIDTHCTFDKLRSGSLELSCIDNCIYLCVTFESMLALSSYVLVFLNLLRSVTYDRQFAGLRTNIFVVNFVWIFG